MGQRRTDKDQDLHRERRDAGAEGEALDPEANADAGEAGVPSVNELAAAAAEAAAESEGQGKLRQELARLKQEAADAQDRYLRTYADFENYRKRMQRDLAEFRKYANEQMALDLLAVVDHIALAIKHAQEAGGSSQGLLEGVELIYRQFLDVLEKYNIRPFKAEGEPFDPKLHDAMMQVETSDAPENTVVQVFQDGYLYHEKVLRHARVGVSKPPAGAAAGRKTAEPETAAAGGNDLEADE